MQGSKIFGKFAQGFSGNHFCDGKSVCYVDFVGVFIDLCADLIVFDDSVQMFDRFSIGRPFDGGSVANQNQAVDFGLDAET